MHWRDLLPLQNYLSVVIVFLMIEQAFNYGYYENFNVHGKNCKKKRGRRLFKRSLNLNTKTFSNVLVGGCRNS